MISEHSNASLLRQGYAAYADESFATKEDYSVFEKILADDVVFHVGGRNQLSGVYRSRNEVLRFFKALKEVTEGTYHIAVESILADDHYVMALVTTSGTRRGGATISTKDVHVYRIKNGMVVEFWQGYTDQYATDHLVG